MLLCLPLALTTRASAAVENQTGEQIYQQQCLSCHGKQGEGSPRSTAIRSRAIGRSGQLAKYIAKSMPDDDPGSCVGEDADKVAAYIYDAFYSKTAQARNKPARIELSRLTVRQYHNTVADLIGSFRGPTVVGRAQGAARRILQVAAVPQQGRSDHRPRRSDGPV